MTLPMLDIIVPVLNRPANVHPLLHSIWENTTVEYRVIFVVSMDDPTELAAIRPYAGTEESVHILIAPWPGGSPGDYARKINKVASTTGAPFIFMGADDLNFHQDWDVNGLYKFTDESIGVVGTNDLGNPWVMEGKQSTHSFVRSEYVHHAGTIDEIGKVLHEGYHHNFVDNELVETAQHRGAFIHAHDSVVEHLHPDWGKAQRDHVYNIARDSMDPGREIYNQRRHLWCG